MTIDEPTRKPFVMLDPDFIKPGLVIFQLHTSAEYADMVKGLSPVARMAYVHNFGFYHVYLNACYDATEAWLYIYARLEEMAAQLETVPAVIEGANDET